MQFGSSLGMIAYNVKHLAKTDISEVLSFDFAAFK